MPYYLFRLTQRGPIRQCETLESHPDFKTASARAKVLRNDPDAAQAKIQVVFGETELQAEEALNTVRQPEPFTAADL